MAKEYIEREKVLHEMTSTPLPRDAQHLYLAMRNMVKNAPAADVVEVVRCKGCRMFVDNKSALTTYCTREHKNLNVKPDDFCSYGERRKEDG